MPDTPATSSPPSSSSSSSKSTFGFLTKRIGPVPVWVIIVAIVGLWYWYFHYGPGSQAKTTTPAAAGTGRRGQVVNVRIIDTPRRTGVGHVHEDRDDINPGGPNHPADVDTGAAVDQNTTSSDLTTRWRSP